MPFKAFYLSPGGQLHSGLSEEAIQAAFASGEGLLWVDISEPSENDGMFLGRVFNFHPLTIEDCTETSINNPKVDDFGDYLFMVFHGVNYAAETLVIQTTSPPSWGSDHNARQAGSGSLDYVVSLDALPLSCGRSRVVLVP